MRQLLALLLGGLALVACQGSRPLYPTGLYRTAEDFRAQRPTPAGTGAGRVFLARKAYVKTGPGQRRRVPLDSLWGYAGADHAAYRVYRHRAYEVAQDDTLMLYSTPTPDGRGGGHYVYFSPGPGGPVRLLTRHQLRRAYAGNPAFLAALRQLPLLASLRASRPAADGTRSYRVEALYRQALGLPAARGR